METAEEKPKYDYMTRMQDVFTAIGEDDSLEGLLKAKDIIAEISSYVETTELFTSSKARYDDMIVEFDKIEDKKDRAKKSWIYFLNKVNDAPTQLHLIGVVILVIPIVNKYLFDL